MNYREVTLLAKKSVGDSGTETFDLDIRDPLTELTVYFEQDNHDALVSNYPAERNITKIEIVDGGKSLFSLNGSEAMGVAVVERGAWPLTFYNEARNQNFWSNIPIQFGRYIGDPEYGFDATKLRNPQLKVTYTKQALHETLKNEIAIYAKVLEGVPSPPKCLLWRGIRSYTSTASSTEGTALPTDYPYRRLSIRAFATTTTYNGMHTNFKLACDVDKLVVFDLGYRQMQAMVLGQFGPFTNTMKAQVSGAQVREAWLIPCWSVSADPMGYNKMCRAYATWGGYVSVDIRDFNGAAQEDGVMIQAIGMNPHHCTQYQFGLPDDPATWFRSSQYGGVKLTLEHGTVAGAISIAVQQPVVLSPP